MIITLNLAPEVEKGLLVLAHAKGVSLTEYLEQVAAREAHAAAETPPLRTGQALVDACAEVRGLLTDEEIDTLFARNRSMSRPVDLS
ncbi:MAG: hypothetical protein ACKV22_29035 [Bryobacteraceae bacterium]